MGGTLRESLAAAAAEKLAAIDPGQVFIDDFERIPSRLSNARVGRIQAR